MTGVLLSSLLILLLVVAGAIFVAAEIALVSLRESQVSQLAHRGKRGQLVAKLTSNPNLFLSVVQVGVTLSGFLAAAFGADKLSDDLAPLLERLGLSSGVADTVSLILITIVISYVSIVVGELTAKRLALQRAEGVALGLAPLVDFTANRAAGDLAPRRLHRRPGANSGRRSKSLPRGGDQRRDSCDGERLDHSWRRGAPDRGRRFRGR